MKRNIKSRKPSESHKGSNLFAENDLRKTKKNHLFLAGVLVLTFMAYFPSLHNELVNWDDGMYIPENFLIKTLNWENVKTIFSEPYFGQYHPLHLLSYAVEYHVFGESPFIYHFTNLLLHLLITYLVYRLVLIMLADDKVALITALLFGVHALHVESVAWVSERKDLLYTSFYLIASLNYFRYIEGNNKTRNYLYTLLFFMLAVLSKATAVSFSVLIFLYDYMKGRAFTFKTITEKIPFLLLSILFGVLFVQAQQVIHSIQGYTQYTFFDRLILANYSLVSYWMKLILPIHLSAFYPYPQKAGNILSVVYWIYSLIVLIVGGFIYHKRKHYKILFMGALFFLITVALTLQLLGSGQAIMADRYAYIPSIGFFFIAAYYLQEVMKKKGKIITRFVTILIGIYVLGLSIMTWNRCKIWKNSFALWNDVILKYPGQVPIAYSNRGNIYVERNEYQAALLDYTQAVELDTFYVEAYYNRGFVYYNTHRIPEAMADYTRAIQFRYNYAEAYNGRGIAKFALKDYNGAMEDFSRAISFKPELAQAHFNMGIACLNLGKRKLACPALKRSTELGYQQAINIYNKECQ